MTKVTAPAYSPPCRQALRTPGHGQQHGGPQTDLLVSGQDADRRGRTRHDEHGDDEDALAADAVAEMPEDRSAQRPQREGHGEDRERLEEVEHRIVGAEESMGDIGGHEAVDREVEPFDDRAGESGDCRFPQRRRVHCRCGSFTSLLHRCS